MRVLYFGAIDRPGHYLHEGRKVIWSDNNIPWREGELDGKLCVGVRDTSYGWTADRKDQVEGRAKLTHKDGWTALAFWDRSVDHRYNSNSTFVIEGTHNAADAIALARDAYPWIWERFGFDVVVLFSTETNEP